MLDTDECFPRGAADPIRRLVAESRLNHFWIRRQWLVPAGRRVGTIVAPGIDPDMLPNLFVRKEARGYIGKVHTTLRGFGAVANWAPYITVYHLDLVVNSRAERIQKVARYERSVPGAGYPHLYLWEDYGYATRPVPWEDLPPAAAGLLGSYLAPDQVLTRSGGVTVERNATEGFNEFTQRRHQPE